MTDYQPHLAHVDALARGDAVVRAKLEMLVDIMVRLVPGCDSAGVALLLEGRAATVAVTDHVALEVDLLQYRHGEGPCLDAVEDAGQVVRVDLVDNGSAYRRLAPGALDAGIRSVLAVPLYEGSRVIGSLNVYSTTADAFDEAAELAVAPIAELAATTIAESPVLPAAVGLVEVVVAAMEESSLVSQAVGIVMAERTCSRADAQRALDQLERVFGCASAAAQAVLRDPALAKVIRE